MVWGGGQKKNERKKKKKKREKRSSNYIMIMELMKLIGNREQALKGVGLDVTIGVWCLMVCLLMSLQLAGGNGIIDAFAPDADGNAKHDE